MGLSSKVTVTNLVQSGAFTSDILTLPTAYVFVTRAIGEGDADDRRDVTRTATTFFLVQLGSGRAFHALISPTYIVSRQ